MSNEQIYLYRRKGLSDYATCDRARYVELSQHKLFETMVCYASPEPEEGDHEGRQLEWERCENKRLRAELGECKGEYDRAVNKVDAMRDQLAEAHSLFADVLSIDVPRTAQSLERMRSILSGSAEPATIEYRLLAAGDTITATDEYLEDDAATWSPVRPGIFNGMKYIRGAMVPVRRAITSEDPANKEGAQ